jgi:hypothetical protein
MKRLIFLIFISLLQNICFAQNFSLSKLIEIPKKSKIEIKTFLKNNNYVEEIGKKYLAKADTLEFLHQPVENLEFLNCKIIYPQGVDNKSQYRIVIDIKDSLIFTRMMEEEVTNMGFRISNYYRIDNTKGLSIYTGVVKSIVNVVEYKRGDELIEFIFEEKATMFPMVCNGSCRYGQLSFINLYHITYRTRDNIY